MSYHITLHCIIQSSMNKIVRTIGITCHPCRHMLDLQDESFIDELVEFKCLMLLHSHEDGPISIVSSNYRIILNAQELISPSCPQLPSHILSGHHAPSHRSYSSWLGIRVLGWRLMAISSSLRLYLLSCKSEIFWIAEWDGRWMMNQMKMWGELR